MAGFVIASVKSGVASKGAKMGKAYKTFSSSASKTPILDAEGNPTDKNKFSCQTLFQWEGDFAYEATVGDELEF